MLKRMRLFFLPFLIMTFSCFSYEWSAEENNASVIEQSNAKIETTPEITVIDDTCKMEVYLKFSPDGKELARLPQFGMPYLSDTSNYSNKVRSFQIGMRMVDYSSDGSKIVTAEGTDGARVWDARATGKQLKYANIDELFILDTPLKVLETPSRDRGNVVFWAEFSPDNKHILTAQANGHVKVWNTDSWEMESDISLTKNEVLAATFSPDSKLIAIGDIRGGIYLWDVKKKTETKRIKLEGGSEVAVMGLVFANNGKLLISSHWSRTYPEVRIWDTQNWIYTTEKNFRCAAVSSNGKILALGGDGQVKLIDLESNKAIKIIDIIDPEKNYRAVIRALAFSPDGKVLAVGSSLSLQLVSLNLINPEGYVNEADKNRGVFSLLQACKNGNTEAVRLLLDKGADINEVDPVKGYFPLLLASQNGHTEVVRLLLDKKANVNEINKKSGTFPLLQASHNGHAEVVKLLLDKGADLNVVDKTGDFLLLLASRQGHLEIVKLLLEKEADLNAVDPVKGTFPLFLASQNGHTEVVRLLLGKGADINMIDKRGSSSLNIACGYGQVEVVKVLLNKGANVNEKHRTGSSPLLQAIANSKIGVVRLLLDKGADVNVVDNKGSSALTMASIKGDTEIVKLLLDKEADVNEMNKTSLSPLITASGHGHIEVVKLLIDKGADVNAAHNFSGLTPLKAAIKGGNDAIVNLLRENGAK